VSHARTVAVVHAVADGVPDYRAEQPAHHHADGAVVPVCNLAADYGAGDTADHGADFVTVTAAARDAVIVAVDRAAFALVALGLFVWLVAIAMIFLVIT